MPEFCTIQTKSKVESFLLTIHILPSTKWHWRLFDASLKFSVSFSLQGDYKRLKITFESFIYLMLREVWNPTFHRTKVQEKPLNWLPLSWYRATRFGDNSMHQYSKCSQNVVNNILLECSNSYVLLFKTFLFGTKVRFTWLYTNPKGQSLAGSGGVIILARVLELVFQSMNWEEFLPENSGWHVQCE